MATLDDLINLQEHKCDRGMNLRDWFAGLAMQAMITTLGDKGLDDLANNDGICAKNLGHRAYCVADAMLYERA